MRTNLAGGALAFCVGAAIAAVCYALSRYVLKTHPSRYPITQILRQLIQVCYLVALFLLGDYTPWNAVWLLVGGCLGITLPMFYFTHRLVKLNDSLNRKEDSDG